MRITKANALDTLVTLFPDVLEAALKQLCSKHTMSLTEVCPGLSIDIKEVNWWSGGQLCLTYYVKTRLPDSDGNWIAHHAKGDGPFYGIEVKDFKTRRLLLDRGWETWWYKNRTQCEVLDPRKEVSWRPADHSPCMACPQMYSCRASNKFWHSHVYIPEYVNIKDLVAIYREVFMKGNN